MEQHILVTKRNGEREPFSEEKVRRSMNRVGVPADYQPALMEHIKKELRDGATTQDIFSHIQDFLKDKDQKSSIRYNLKQAIFDLGPTGFPFEKYISRIFEDTGYDTLVDQTLWGECVSHEIDVIIEKNGEKEFIEAKFHNQQGIKTDVHVLMYTYARFLDIAKKNNISGVWVVTNTKLSEDAITYARCKGIKTIAWNYPDTGNLQDFVELPRMYPITLLKELSNEEKQQLLNNNIVLCCDLVKVSLEDLKDKFYINSDRLKRAKESAAAICGRE